MVTSTLATNRSEPDDEFCPSWTRTSTTLVVPARQGDVRGDVERHVTSGTGQGRDGRWRNDVTSPRMLQMKLPESKSAPKRLLYACSENSITMS